MAYASSGEAQIYYEVHGEGPAVVFAHGRGGNAASWWRQAPAFATEYKAIVFDHRCFGRSRCPTESFDRELFDADILAVLNDAGVDKAAFVCQSMGGWTGLRTALRHPDRVTGLVMSNTPGGVDIPAVREAYANAQAAFAAKGVGAAALAPDFPAREPEAAFLYRQINSLNLQIPEALGYGGEGWVSVAELEEFATPTLYVSSEYDEIFPPEAIRKVADVTPGADFIELPGAGHSPYFEIPETFNETVRSFLRSL